MVQQEKDFAILFLTKADLDVIRHFEEWMQITKLPKPNHQVIVKMLMAESADVDRFAESEILHRDRGPSGIEILGVSSKYLAFLRLDNITP